jgi:uncharacterized protein
MEKVIIDAGPLVAYLDADEESHAWTMGIFGDLTEPMLTCDAALGEAFFLLRETSGGTEKLIQLLERGIVISTFHLADEMPEIARLMRKYRTVPMSLADACLVRMAEIWEGARVFTMDADFRIYRKNGRQIIPLMAPD